MALIILLICFTSTFLCFGISTKLTGKKELLIGTALVFSAILVAITEILSLLHQLNYLSILISWLLITFLSLLYLFLNHKKALQYIHDLNTGIRKKLSSLTKIDKILLAVSIIILLLVFIQAILYPPNNYDSMTYHMARITSWISHQSVSHYPTSITRQLYQPPFSEYVIMHFGILSRTDLFSNIVQFIFLLFSLVTLVSIVESFGLGKPYKIMAIVLGITIPEVILQASSTQNDVVVAFFILTTFLFAIKSFKQQQVKNYVFTGLATGLGLLTKGTAYVYLPPILLLFGIVVMIQLFKHKNYNSLWYSLVAVIIVVGLNAGHFSRNYQLTNNMLGVDKTESASYSNQKMNAGYLLSNVIKNAGLHTGVMFFKPAAIFSNKAIYKVHQIMGVDINDPATNYRNLQYKSGSAITDEDGSSNPFHLLFIVFSALLILWYFIKGRRNIAVTSLWLIVIVQVLFFCLYLKWQPWHSRLHIPMFLMSVPLICYCLSLNVWYRRIIYGFTPIILAYALLVVLHNDRKPYGNKIFGDRYKNYFLGNPSLYPEYDSINRSLQKSIYKNIGLIMGVDDWEYPLFTRAFSTEINPIYIEVDNFSKNAPPVPDNVDCIVSTTVNKPFIDFKGSHYINRTPADKRIWLYGQ